MSPAPIALFVYNRLEHTEKTVGALAKNNLAKESQLFVFSDGFKGEEDKEKVERVREYLKTITGFKSVEIFEKEKNSGLANSIIAGVTGIVNKYSRVIVVEDDLVSSPYFLTYMNEALELYEKEEKVVSIHGFIYPVKKTLPETFFLRGADCWGWATWKRAWDLFEPDGEKLLEELENRNLINEFDLEGSFHYSNMLKRQIEGKTNSWAIRWHASCFLREKLTLYPGHSLLDNIGQDDTGTHKAHKSIHATVIYNQKVKVGGIKIEENKEAREVIKEYFLFLRPGIQGRIKNFIKRTMLPILRNFIQPQKYGFFGDYPTWQKALDDSLGYDSQIILEKVKGSALKVKLGEAAFERDSIAFDKKEYSTNLINSLLSIAAHNNSLNLLDFGGSLGSSYFQHLDLLRNITPLKWSVVEQDNFTKIGKEFFEDEHLKFYNSIKSASSASENLDVVLFGSSLQYLEFPYKILEEVTELGVENIIIERTPFHQSKDVITIQKVPPKIYDVIYPAWIFNLSKMVDFLKDRGYILSSELTEGSMPRGKKGKVELKGLFFNKNAK